MTLIVKHKSTPNQSTQYLSLLETTGVFGVLNPGGYGASQIPTGSREVSDIASSDFYILESDGSLTFNGDINPVLINDLYTINYGSTDARLIANGTVQTFDLATLIGVNYVDGVYKSVYIVRFEGISFVTTLGILSNTLVVQDYNEFTNASYIYFNDIGDGFAGAVKIISVNTNNTLTLEREVAVSNENYSVLYESTAYFANTYNINKCLHSKIAQLSLSNCSCKNKSTEKLYEAVMLYMSIQPNMDLGKYTKAQEIINALTIYCNGGECNC